MDIYKIAILILGIGLIVSISVASGIYVSNTSYINNIENELDLANTNLQENVSKLSNKTSELNSIESFFNSYLNGLGLYYESIEIHENADYKFDQAKERYQTGYWGPALAWFEDSVDWYSNTIDKYKEARNVFNNASEFTSNQTYKEICNLYYQMMDKTSIAIVYLFEASEYYVLTCELYLEGNSVEAQQNKNIAEDKISFYEQEMEIVQEYNEDLQNILKNLI